jgi:hypothetical protein
MLILKRSPGDSFTFKLFYKLVSKLSNVDAIYVWSSVLEPSYFNVNVKQLIGGFLEHETEVYFRSVIQENIKKDTVIIGVKDHLTSGEFNPWFNSMPTVVNYLNQLIDFYHDKTIILLTSVENLEKYIKQPNVSIVPWGGDITNHQSEYKNLEPIQYKNFDSKYTYISLNRNERNHRKILLSMLLGMNLQDKGLISCMFKQGMDSCPDITTATSWQFNEDQQAIKKVVENGFNLFKDYKLLLTDDMKIYVNYDNDNVSNFKNKLTRYYQDTFVEIITETSYTEQCYLLTEKTLNSIYGMNFPILLCGQGAVSLLRKMGMDMFDDVVDHSYDQYENPVDRMYAALSKNTRLLTDSDYIIEQWKKCKPRFEQNVIWSKTTMYDFYENRASEIFQNVVKIPHYHTDIDTETK